MFDRALRNILEHKRKEVIGGWRDLHKRAGHVANMRKKKNAWGRDSPNERDHLENLGVEGKKVLKCSLKKYDTRMRAAKNRGLRRALLNTKIKLRVSQNGGEFLNPYPANVENMVSS